MQFLLASLSLLSEAQLGRVLSCNLALCLALSSSSRKFGKATASQPYGISKIIRRTMVPDNSSIQDRRIAKIAHSTARYFYAGDCGIM
jgi:hypothetical protein